MATSAADAAADDPDVGEPMPAMAGYLVAASEARASQVGLPCGEHEGDGPPSSSDDDDDCVGSMNVSSWSRSGGSRDASFRKVDADKRERAQKIRSSCAPPHNAQALHRAHPAPPPPHPPLAPPPNPTHNPALPHSGRLNLAPGDARGPATEVRSGAGRLADALDHAEGLGRGWRGRRLDGQRVVHVEAQVRAQGHARRPGLAGDQKVRGSGQGVAAGHCTCWVGAAAMFSVAYSGGEPEGRAPATSRGPRRRRATGGMCRARRARVDRCGVRA